MNLRLPIGILALCLVSSTNAQRVERNPIWYKDYNNANALKNPICTPSGEQLPMAGKATIAGAVLHRDAAAGAAHTYIDGRAVTSCVEAIFQPTHATKLNVTYRPLHNAVPGCSDGGTNAPPDANTGGEVEMFISDKGSVDNGGTWKTVKDPSGAVVVLGRAQISVSIALRPDAGLIRSVLLCRNAGAETRDDVVIDKVSIDHGKSSPVSDPNRVSLNGFWNQANVDQNSGAFNGQIYQTSSVYALMSGWLIERNPAWKTSILSQINHSVNNKYFDGRFPTSSVPGDAQPILRDWIAREAIAQYHAGDMFYDTDPDILTGPKGVQTLVRNMLGLPTQPVRVVNNNVWSIRDLMFPIYSGSIATKIVQPGSTPGCRVPMGSDPNDPNNFNAKPYVDCESVSPNQNAEVGLIYTLAYFDPRFNFTAAEKQILSKRAQDELYAAISLQTTTSTPGALGLAYGSECLYDTNYGALTLQLLAMANVFWKNADFENAIKIGGSWLNGYQGEGNWAYLAGNNETCGPAPTVPLGFVYPSTAVCSIPSMPPKTGQCETGQEMWNRVTAIRAYTGTSIKTKTTYYSNMFNTARWLKYVDTKYDGRVVFYMNSGMAFTDYFPGAN